MSARERSPRRSPGRGSAPKNSTLSGIGRFRGVSHREKRIFHHRRRAMPAINVENVMAHSTGWRAKFVESVITPLPERRAENVGNVEVPEKCDTKAQPSPRAIKRENVGYSALPRFFALLPRRASSRIRYHGRKTAKYARTGKGARACMAGGGKAHTKTRRTLTWN